MINTLTEYQIITAARGEEALRCAVMDKPHLVILDIHLIGSIITGLHTLSIIKQTLPNLPVIAISGDAGMKDKALQLGADVFIPKPYSPLQLLSTIEGLIS